MTKTSPPAVRMLIGIYLVFLVSPAPKVQAQTAEPSADLSQRVEELQKQVEALRAEMAKLKEEQLAAAPAATATPAPRFRSRARSARALSTYRTIPPRS